VERKLNRLKGYDYSGDGYYFVTICVDGRKCVLGGIENQMMVLSYTGAMVNDIFESMPTHYKNLKLDDYVIMPNHLHAILVIESRDSAPAPSNGRKGDARYTSHTKKNYGLISKSIQSFKSISKKLIGIVWQRSFHDHIIRTEKAYIRIKEYIRNNPLKWQLDVENSNYKGIDSGKYYNEIIGDDSE
jgi:putative transposase